MRGNHKEKEMSEDWHMLKCSTISIHSRIYLRTLSGFFSFFFFFKFKGNTWRFSNMQGIKPTGAEALGIRRQLHILGLATFPALLSILRPADGAGQRMTGFLPACSRVCTHSIFGHPCSKFGRWPGRGPRPCHLQAITRSPPAAV